MRPAQRHGNAPIERQRRSTAARSCQLHSADFAQSERERRPARIVTEQEGGTTAAAAAASGANPVCVMPRSLPRQERFFPAARSSEDRHFAVG